MSFALVLIPVAATVAGGIFAALRPPAPRLVASAQHVAAGAVIAAVAAELVFKLVTAQALGALLAGFTVGTLAVLALRWSTMRIQRRSTGAGGSYGLVAAAGVDVFIDGVVIGIGLEAGGSSGVLLTIALTLELVFLGASVAGDLPPRRAIVIGVTAGLAALLPAGAGIGLLLGGLHGFALDAVLAFAAAVLLFLVTEELLREAHATKDTLVNTALLFTAFLAIVALDIVA